MEEVLEDANAVTYALSVVDAILGQCDSMVLRKPTIFSNAAVVEAGACGADPV